MLARIIIGETEIPEGLSLEVIPSSLILPQ